MGEIVASMELENAVDRDNASEGLRDESTVRRATVEGVVDTGTVMLVLPEDVVDGLGLRTQRQVTVTYADERRDTRPVAGPVTVHIGNRFMIAECVVGPPSSEPLIGQIVLEALDLVADCGRRTLAPRPESPDSPLLKLRSVVRTVAKGTSGDGSANELVARILAELGKCKDADDLQRHGLSAARASKRSGASAW